MGAGDQHSKRFHRQETSVRGRESTHTKDELVTQARLIRGVVPVAVWSMAPYVYDIGVVENLHVKLLQDRVGVTQRRI